MQFGSTVKLIRGTPGPTTFDEDPWISVTDHGPAVAGGKIVYGGDGSASTHAATILPIHNGANVWIRSQAAPIPFTYTYATQPPGCCGGFYDDPGNTIMNDGVKPSSITRSNCVEYQNHGPNSNLYQYQPTIDLGADYAVTSLELSYVAHPAPNKYAPEKVVVSCRSALSASAAAPVRVESTFSGLSNYGGHTVRVDLAQCGRVRYITLERIEPIQGGTNIGELAVLGCQSSPRYCAST